MEEAQQALPLRADLGPVRARDPLHQLNDQRACRFIALDLPHGADEAVHQHEALQVRPALVARIRDAAAVLVRQEDVVVLRQETDRRPRAGTEPP